MAQASFVPESDLNNLTTVRLHTLDLIRDLSQQDFDAMPVLHKWSVGEIADHIIILTDELLGHKFEQLICLKRSGQRPFLWQTFADIDVGFAFVPKAILPLRPELMTQATYFFSIGFAALNSILTAAVIWGNFHANYKVGGILFLALDFSLFLTIVYMSIMFVPAFLSSVQ